MTGINNCACFFLVALRLVIGWHFAVEGWHKIHSHQLGKSSTNTPWAADGFFKEGYGPAANLSRNLVGIDDRAVLRKLKPVDGQFPPALAQEWDIVIATLSAAYQPDESMKQKWETVIAEHRAAAERWLSGGELTDVKKTMSWGPVDLQQTIPQRVADCEAKLREIDEIYAVKLPAFNRDVEKTRLRTLKTDAAKMLADLTGELDSRTGLLRTALAKAATDGGSEIVIASFPIRRIDTVAKVTMWSHLILGGCLLFGLFTRLASVFLAGFLLHVTLIAPALPFAPTPPGAVGQYLYINLYVIEMVALLALACMPTGRWFGLDAIWGARGPKRATVPAHGFTR